MSDKLLIPQVRECHCLQCTRNRKFTSIANKLADFRDRDWLLSFLDDVMESEEELQMLKHCRPDRDKA